MTEEDEKKVFQKLMNETMDELADKLNADLIRNDLEPIKFETGPIYHFWPDGSLRLEPFSNGDVSDSVVVVEVKHETKIITVKHK